MSGPNRKDRTARRARSGRPAETPAARSPWGSKRAAARATRRAETASADRNARRAQIRFALTFLGVAAALFAAYSFPYQENGISEDWFRRYLCAYARLAASVLKLFDGQVRVDGNVISGHMSLHIVKSCDAMEATLLFVAAIVAWPARWYGKLVAGIVGVAGLVTLNVIRICSLYAIGIRFPSAFDLFHIELWPLVIIGAAIAQFVGWALWTRRGRSGREVPVGP